MNRAGGEEGRLTPGIQSAQAFYEAEVNIILSSVTRSRAKRSNVPFPRTLLPSPGVPFVRSIFPPWVQRNSSMGSLMEYFHLEKFYIRSPPFLVARSKGTHEGSRRLQKLVFHSISPARFLSMDLASLYMDCTHESIRPLHVTFSLSIQL